MNMYDLVRSSKNNQFNLEKLKEFDKDIKFFDMLTEYESLIKLKVTRVNIILIVIISYYRTMIHNIYDLYPLHVIDKQSMSSLVVILTCAIGGRLHSTHISC